jgi:hypothetical protein
MRSKNLGAEESFHEICSMIFGPAAPKSTRLDFEQFYNA